MSKKHFGFYLGKHSRRELVGVHPYLAFMVEEAIRLTDIDFMVFDGLRTKKEQEKFRRLGVSYTDNSYHLYGLAVDLIPYVEDKLTWDPRYFPDIARACKEVIKKHDLPIQWGYDMWKWDMGHWQISHLNGKDARSVYDARKWLNV
jgi:peptidoglycan L-alanyl-D-glutamate endopeptidase CwlK